MPVTRLHSAAGNDSVSCNTALLASVRRGTEYTGTATDREDVVVSG